MSVIDSRSLRLLKYCKRMFYYWLYVYNTRNNKLTNDFPCRWYTICSRYYRIPISLMSWSPKLSIGNWQVHGVDDQWFYLLSIKWYNFLSKILKNMAFHYQHSTNRVDTDNALSKMIYTSRMVWWTTKRTASLVKNIMTAS